MTKYLSVLFIPLFWMLAIDVYAQDDSNVVEKPRSFQGPIHKGAFTLGGNFTLGENIQSIQLGAGYFFTDRFGVGLDAIYLNELYLIQILPRYYFPILDNTYLFVELGVNVGDDNVYLTGGAGVTYFLNERIGLQGRLNNFNGGGIGLIVLFPGKNKRQY